MCDDKSQWFQFASLIADGEFICLFAVCTVSDEMSIHVFFFFAHFLIGFVLLNSEGSFCILDTDSL